MINAAELTARVESRRARVNGGLRPETRSELGQFMTPATVAASLAGHVSLARPRLRLLDPGAGIGSLTAAVVSRLLTASERPATVTLTAYEIDPVMRAGLADTLSDCTEALDAVGVQVMTEIIPDDFILAALDGDFAGRYDAAILNPPFAKLAARSRTADRIRSRGWSPANLYTAFWCAAIDQVSDGGDVVAITPRSFCNGTYFRGFRRFLLAQTALSALHVFEARDKAFSGDGVLQETVVTHSVKGARPGRVELAISHRPDSVELRRIVDCADVVHVNDPGAFIRLPVDDGAELVRERMQRFRASLAEIGVVVSTGPVVDFRCRDLLRPNPGEGAVPLLYPTHMTEGGVVWPKLGGRKPNAMAPTVSSKLLVADGPYALVKRFSAKEEPRRVVASYYGGTLGVVAGTPAGAIPLPDVVPPRAIALENHLNYFHAHGRPLSDWMAQALTVFLNSSVVDQYFRQFNGHTQVNAGDLRSLGYPALEQLRILGKVWRQGMAQEDVDVAVDAL